MKKMQLHVYFRFIFFVHGSDIWQQLVYSTQAFRLLYPFSGALFCNRTTRALLHPLPTEQRLLAERLRQSYNAVCAYCPNLAGIRFRSFFFLLKQFRPIRAI